MNENENQPSSSPPPPPPDAFVPPPPSPPPPDVYVPPPGPPPPPPETAQEVRPYGAPPATTPAVSTPPPPPATAGTGIGGDMDAKQWAMFIHLSQLAGYIVPVLGLAAPIVIWQMKREQFPEIDRHGKMVTNWVISVLIYTAVLVLLTVVTCGWGGFVTGPVGVVLGVVAVVYAIIGGLKAKDGIFWPYPGTITFLK